METKTIENYGKELGEALVQSTDGIKKVVDLMTEMKEVMPGKLKQTIDDPKSTAEEIAKAKSDLDAINRANLDHMKQGMKTIDTAMGQLKARLMSSFRG